MTYWLNNPHIHVYNPLLTGIGSTSGLKLLVSLTSPPTRMCDRLRGNKTVYSRIKDRIQYGKDIDIQTAELLPLNINCYNSYTEERVTKYGDLILGISMSDSERKMVESIGCIINNNVFVLDLTTSFNIDIVSNVADMFQEKWEAKYEQRTIFAFNKPLFLQNTVEENIKWYINPTTGVENVTFNILWSFIQPELINKYYSTYNDFLLE